MKKWNVYAPVIIPTLCRYEHFKRCVESLSRCTGAEYTDLYIGLDYPFKEAHTEGYQKICEYVNTIRGFKNVFVFKRETNLGVTPNARDLRARVQEKYDRYIYTEDDNEFAPNYLEYMNAGLELYKDHPDVLYICGYLIDWGGDFEKCMGTYKYNAFPAKDFNASGYGMWTNKIPNIELTKISVLNSWKLTFKAFRKGYCRAINRMVYQLHKESQLPDVCKRLYCAFNNKYCIFPRVSKVRNWGYDGTGLNSDNNPKWIMAVNLDTATDFEFDDFEVKDYKEVKQFVYQMYACHPGVSWIRSHLGVLRHYLFYRITGMRILDIPEGSNSISFLWSFFIHKLKFIGKDDSFKQKI